MPIIKGTVVSYSVEDNNVYFKVLTFKDNLSIGGSSKKTYGEFKELDQIIESKYAKQIKKGLLNKVDLPRKDDYNFKSISSLE